MAKSFFNIVFCCGSLVRCIHKRPFDQDKVFVHWKEIQTDDRFPRLQQGLQMLGEGGGGKVK